MKNMTQSRILHVVGGMDRGGVEMWLMHVLRHIDRDRFQMDFLVHTNRHCAYDDEIRSLGSRIIPCLYPAKPWLYTRNLLRILRNYGPYDVVHSHVHHFSGMVLRVARAVGVPIRIAHSHSDTVALQATASLMRRGYLALMKYWIAQNATIGLAASRRAAVSLFGEDWELNQSNKILYCGIDISPFRASFKSSDVRCEFGIPDSAFVTGHVGRFVEPKNHAFLLDIFAEVVAREPNAYLLLVGAGPLRTAIEKKTVDLGLEDHVVFAGSRSDIPRLMLGAMDVFIFPSRYEGLGLVLIEAQAAGLPCIYSDVVPNEADLMPPLLRRLSLSQPPAAWAEAVLEVRNRNWGEMRATSLSVVENSPFNIISGVCQLEEIYCG